MKSGQIGSDEVTIEFGGQIRLLGSDVGRSDYVSLMSDKVRSG